MAVSDSIIIELLERIQKCESQIKTLSELVGSLSETKSGSTSSKELQDDAEDEYDDEKTLTRGPARELVMNKMRELLPSAKIRTANRSEGSGIVISDSNGKRKFKFYHSRSYDLSNENIISWSGIMKDDLDNAFDAYIFSIWYNEKQYVLLFTHQQLIDVINSTNKLVDSNNKYHFSFTIKIIGQNIKVLETRSPNSLDVSYSFENYKII